MVRVNIWIYKWDQIEQGVFYGLDENAELLKGYINFKVETNACNWVVVFTKEKELPKLPDFLSINKIEHDSEHTWWCTKDVFTANDFIAGKHLHNATFLYFNSLKIHKYATFLNDNQTFLGLTGVAAVKNIFQPFVSQYFLQQLYRNVNFSAIGLFEIEYDERRGNCIQINDPFENVKFHSSDFKYRPNFKVVSFDLEVATTDGSGEFPNGLSESEMIVGISTSAATMEGSSGNQINDVVTKLWLLVPSHLNYENPKAMVYHDERTMIMDFLRYLDGFLVVLGFNSNEFDNNILIARMLRFQIPLPVSNRKFLMSWSSKEEYEYIIITKPYQDSIDLMKYYVKFYQGKTLETYKLETIARTILGRGKNDLKVSDIHRVYTQLYAGSKETGYLDLLCEYMATDSILPLQLFFESCVYNLTNVFCCLGFCNVEDVYGSISGLSNNYLFYNFFKERKPFAYEKVAAREDKATDKGDGNNYFAKVNRAKKTYAGGFVINPVPGRYLKVFVFDFASLYPSCIMFYNISPGYVYCISKSEYVDIYDVYFHSIEVDGYILLTPKLSEPPLPKLERFLVEKRQQYKPFKQIPYFAAMEQALKLLANAIYGQLGLNALTFVADRHAASAVTAYGRQNLNECISFFETKDSLVIYGDTDSIFVAMSEQAATEEAGHKLVKEYHEWIGRDFPKLEFEDIFTHLIVVSKKGYIGKRLNGEYKITGFPKVLPKIMANFLRNVARYVLEETDVDNFKKWIHDRVFEFIPKAKDTSEFVQMKKLKSNIFEYSKKCNLPHIIFARELVAQGFELGSFGGQIYYVPVLKDIKTTWGGNNLELEHNVTGMTVNLLQFATAYLGKLKSLLEVIYDLPKAFLLNLFSDANNVVINDRLRYNSDPTNICVWHIEKGKSMSYLPDVRQFYMDWFNFCIKINCFNKPKVVQTLVTLTWIPTKGFTYTFNGYLSELRVLYQVEKLFTRLKVVPTLKIMINEKWTLTNFLTDILGLIPDTMNDDVKIHVTPYGVFDDATFKVYDCLEKCICNKEIV